MSIPPSGAAVAAHAWRLVAWAADDICFVLNRVLAMAAIGRSPYNGSDSGTLLPSLSAPLLCEFLQLSSDSNSLLSQLGKAHLLVWCSGKQRRRASKTTTDRWYSIISLSEEEGRAADIKFSACSFV